MNRIFSLCCVTSIALVSAVAVHQAAAQDSSDQSAGGQSIVANPPIFLRDYRFIPIDTTVHVTGGPQNYNLNLTIVGGFGLETGYLAEPTPVASSTSSSGLEPFAKFVNVHGILVNPISASPVPVTTVSTTPLPTPGWDLDKTLNLSGLTGTFTPGDPNDLFFLGADGQGVAERYEATLSDGWLHLTGGTTDPPSTNAVLYQVNAWAHLLPFPDFNADGVISAADVVEMEQALANPQAFEAQNDLTSDDLLALGDVNGDGKFNGADLQALLAILKTGGGSAAAPIPEPAGFTLFVLAVSGWCIIRRRV
ncbi:MAG TPA: dockerin type I repeat-containing protein [Pirellulales bacterium]|nr:dockerin type I repeat-containing protein [Pirellulales bacterium]